MKRKGKQSKQYSLTLESSENMTLMARGVGDLGGEYSPLHEVSMVSVMLVYSPISDWLSREDRSRAAACGIIKSNK